MEITKSLLNGNRQYIEHLGIQCDEKWPTEDTMDILPIINHSLEQSKLPTGFEHERGKGFGTEALNAIMEWLRLQESVKVIQAECLISNKPSAVLLEKAGLKEVTRDDEFIYWKLVK